MNHYKKLAGDENIDWIDISKSQVELKEEGIKYQDAMRVIHIKDESGVHQVGIEAIFTLWDKLPYYRQLSRWLKRTRCIHPLFDKAYVFFAKHRMKLPGRSTSHSDLGGQQ
jgi:predicted DCC family thiol-disulfide oxidoreductase YuxK